MSKARGRLRPPAAIPGRSLGLRPRPLLHAAVGVEAGASDGRGRWRAGLAEVAGDRLDGDDRLPAGLPPLRGLALEVLAPGRHRRLVAVRHLLPEVALVLEGLHVLGA